MTELERVARLARAFATSRAGVRLGIGDDAAVLDPPPGAALVWTIDEQIEGTHFRRELLSWNDVGWRSMIAAASDLFAMGASPWCALAAVAAPAELDEAAFDAIVEGQRAAADAAGAAVVGGNLARGPVVSVATTLLGTCARAVTRGGAVAGDGVWIAGDVGLAAAGLRALVELRRDRALDAAIDRWRRPLALVREGLVVAARASACIDVSDGLARDVAHMARASGVRVVLDAGRLVEHGGEALARAAAALASDPVDLALYGGEDYALVATSAEPMEGFSRVGDVEASTAQAAGVFVRDAAGTRAIEPGGFDHFPSRHE